MTKRRSFVRSLLPLGACFPDPYSDRLLSILHERNWDKALKLIRRGEGLRWTSFGWTVLHFAMWKTVPESIVVALLQGGLSANEPDNEDGKTALHFAVQFHPVTVPALLDHSADSNRPDHGGITPIAVAAAKGQPDVLQLLIDAGGNVNCSSNDGTTPLMCAAMSPSGSDCVRLLLAHGANRQATNVNGETALDLARRLDLPNQQTIALLDSRIGILLAFCSVHILARERRRRSQSAVAMLPLDLIRNLGKMLGK